MRYKTVREYVVALESDRSLAVISKTMAADFRGVSRSAIEGLISRGELEEIKIADTRCVRVSSLLAKAKETEKMIKSTESLLEQLARKEESIFYEPVMSPLGLQTNSPPDRKAIAEILGEISTKTHKEHGILLTVLVHKKTAGRTRPSTGFFDLADHLGYKWDNDDDFVEEQMKRVFRHYSKK